MKQGISITTSSGKFFKASSLGIGSETDYTTLESKWLQDSADKTHFYTEGVNIQKLLEDVENLLKLANLDPKISLHIEDEAGLVDLVTKKFPEFQKINFEESLLAGLRLLEGRENAFNNKACDSLNKVLKDMTGGAETKHCQVKAPLLLVDTKSTTKSYLIDAPTDTQTEAENDQADQKKFEVKQVGELFIGEKIITNLAKQLIKEDENKNKTLNQVIHDALEVAKIF